MSHPWNSLGQNTEVCSLSLLQGIFPTQGLNPGLPHCGWILYQLSHKASPRILEWVAYSFSSGSSWPKNRTGVSCLAGRIFIDWAKPNDFPWFSTTVLLVEMRNWLQRSVLPGKGLFYSESWMTGSKRKLISNHMILSIYLFQNFNFRICCHISFLFSWSSFLAEAISSPALSHYTSFWSVDFI